MDAAENIGFAVDAGDFEIVISLNAHFQESLRDKNTASGQHL
jgi:hypothetical protein